MSDAFIRRDRSVLVLVDYQLRLMPAIHRAPHVLSEALCLADVASLLGVPVLGTEQNPGGLGPNVPALRERCSATLAKMHFDACADGLPALLRRSHALALPEVVLAGCEAHVCLLQTGLGLLRTGHTVWVVAPACGSRSSADHALAMQRLQTAGARVVTTEMVIFEWLHSCDHPQFKAVLQRLKHRDAERLALV